MLSNKPYLLRAFYQWIVDSKCTPILVIDATHPRCQVPKEYIEEGEIVFNVSPTAVRDMQIFNDRVEFKASFSGVIHIIFAPMKAILSVYAEENNEGIFFDANEEEGEASEAPEPIFNAELQEADVAISEKATGKPPFLRLVE